VKRAWAIGLCLALSGSPVLAAEPGDKASPSKSSPKSAEDEGFGDDDDGFGEDGDDDGFGEGDGDGDGFGGLDDADVTIEPPKPWSLTGFIRSQWSLWAERFDGNPFAKARQNIDLKYTYVDSFFKVVLSGHAEYDFAYLVERDSYDDPTLKAFEWLVETRDVYVAFTFGDVTLSLGRQIVAWGDGDSFSPLDVVNPRDQREPGLSDLDDLRLPSLATRLQISTDVGLMVELMVVHEAWFGFVQPLRGPFSPFDKLLADDPTVAQLLGNKTLEIDHVQDRFDGDNQQFFARAVYKGSGIDMGFHVASVLDRQGVLVPPDPAGLLTADPIVLQFDHPRVLVVGWSGAFPYDDFVFKWEVATEVGKPVNVGLPPANFAISETDLLTTMLSVSYSGIDDLNLGVEFQKPIMLRDPAAAEGQELLIPIEAPAFAVRAIYTGLDEKLNISAVATWFGWEAEVGLIARAEVSYKFVDALTLGLSFITYHPGDDFGPFYGLDRHDRINLNLRWDFTIF